jgi:hypothetical protein
MLTVLLADHRIAAVVVFITSLVLPDLVLQKFKTLGTDPMAHCFILGRSLAYSPLTSRANGNQRSAHPIKTIHEYLFPLPRISNLCTNRSLRTGPPTQSVIQSVFFLCWTHSDCLLEKAKSRFYL